MIINSLGGALPVLDWESQDLPRSLKTFQTHVKFIFNEQLKSKTEEEKYNKLMIWVGNKGREVYSTSNLSADDLNYLKIYMIKLHVNILNLNQTECLLGLSSSYRPVWHLWTDFHSVTGTG